MLWCQHSAFAAAVAEGETEAGVPVACLINNAGCMLLSVGED